MNRNLVFRYRVSLGIFIVGLVISGLSAFPLLSGLSLIVDFLGNPDPADFAAERTLPNWFALAHDGLSQTHARYPFLLYGYDWLAFGHLVIAMFFVGPFVRPESNRWVLHAGLAACAGVILVALICGTIRSIPWFWQLIDCSFGILGAIPLLYCVRLSRKLDSVEL